MAKFLAQKYTQMGLDPSAAYDSPEDAFKDFDLNDFK